ncbi:hypothetical protein FPOAC2_13972 [Fusarium poae]
MVDTLIDCLSITASMRCKVKGKWGCSVFSPSLNEGVHQKRDKRSKAMGLRGSDGQNVLASCNQVSRNVFPCVAVVFSLFHPSRRPSFKRPEVAAMEDDSQPFDPTQWDYDDLDFRTPQLSGINSRGVSASIR